mgnify:FL=1
MNQEKDICIYGARMHNLKNIDLKIPRNQLVVFTGKSGSGKSSLAFDTIHAEGQRRYLETFNAYARQFLGNMKRPDVDKITGLSPVVAIEQKTTSKNPRSTVGTVTEIYDYLRLLFSRVASAYSYKSGKKMVRFTNEEILTLLLSKYKGKDILLLSPLVRSRKGHYQDLFQKLIKKGYLNARIDNQITSLDPTLKLDRYKIHDIEVVIDRLKVSSANRRRLERSVKLSIKEGNGVVMVVIPGEESPSYYSQDLMCPETGISYKNPEPNSFSFNSPKGACPSCNGLGVNKVIDIEKIIPNQELSIASGAIAPIRNKKSEWFLSQIEIIGKKFNFTLNTSFKNISKEGKDAILYGIEDTFKVKLRSAKISKTYKIDFDGIANFIKQQYEFKDVKSLNRWASRYMSEENCPRCKGGRLNMESMSYKLAGKNITELTNMSISDFSIWIDALPKHLSIKESIISKQILLELKKRIDFIIEVGLSYLSLNRGTKTLSGGEAQRIRLATQIGSQLTNILYILDEPSIGLHQRDNQKLINSLKKLRDIGNSIIVVEHDKDMIISSDYIVDLGPNAGINGGNVVSIGNIKDIINGNNTTAKYILGEEKIDVPKNRRNGTGNFIEIYGARGNNLKNIDVKIPLGLLCCITGVSGSGKSTLINETLYPILNQHFYNSEKNPLPYKGCNGLSYVDKVIEVNQAPIGRTPRSNPATYTGLFSDIRNLFANLKESKARAYNSGRFSFNVQGGRCEECKGAGVKTIEMNFLPDVHVHCKDCDGKRYNRETLEIRYKGKSIYDVLDLTVAESLSFFENIPAINRKIKAIYDVGLGYIKLGQPATTLSGGEAQRIKLASELSKKNTGNTLYILDEPTTGLHFEDIKVLLDVMSKIIEQGSTMIVIEHNMDIIKSADYIIDLGPEGGDKGGFIVSEGKPEYIVKQKIGYTQEYLKNEI